MIQLDEVSVVFEQNNNQIQAIDQVTVSIERGEWVSILGPSGSGKTTLLNVISGLVPASSGSVYYNDTNINDYSSNERQQFRRDHIGYVFQDFRLFEQYTALENVMLPQLPYQPKAELRKTASRRLDNLKLTSRLHAFPNELSGGEKQRTAIARALVHEPDLLLCDEPTGNLDAENRENILHILKELHNEGITIVLVTHDLEVAKWGDRELHLKDGKVIGRDNR